MLNTRITKLFENLKSGLVIGITALIVMILGGLVYANINNFWTSPSELIANPGDALTAESWNKVISNFNVFQGMIVAFNLTTCPDGWLPADGNNGTPDLRGEFIRGLDNGRKVDTGRILASSQSDQFKSHSHDYYGVYQGGSVRYVGNGGAIISTKIYSSTSAGGTETRPRNVALLYCVKQ